MDLFRSCCTPARVTGLDCRERRSRTTDGPQLHFEIRVIAGHVDCDTAAFLETLPVFALALELEVVVAGVVWNLARGHRQRFGAYAANLLVDQVANDFDRTDLDLLRELASELVGRH